MFSVFDRLTLRAFWTYYALLGSYNRVSLAEIVASDFATSPDITCI